MIETIKQYFLKATAGIPAKAVLLFVLLSLSAFMLSKCEKTPAPQAKVFTAAAPIPSVAVVPQITVPMKRLTVYDKPALAKKVKLPAVITETPANQVTATATLPASEGYDVLAFTNTSTGASSIVAMPKPRPFLAIESAKEVGIRYGLSTRAGQGGDVYGRYSFLRIGGAHLALYGEASTDPSAKIMAELSYRW